MRLAVLTIAALALSAAGAAHAAASAGPMAGYREDATLSCEQLRTEILETRAAAARSAERARQVQLADARVMREATSLTMGRFLEAGAVAAPSSPNAEARREARLRSAERRLQAARARLSLLAGLHQARGCAEAGPRPRPGLRYGPETAQGAAD